MRFGTLSIDPVNRQVMLSGELIALSTADFDLLWELATHAGQIMDRDALLKNLRGVSYDGMDRSVDVAISRLRKNCWITPRNLTALKPYAIRAICLHRTPGKPEKGTKTGIFEKITHDASEFLSVPVESYRLYASSVIKYPLFSFLPCMLFLWAFFA